MEENTKQECLQKILLLVRKCNWNTYIIIISVITLWTTEQMWSIKNNLRYTLNHAILYNLTITCTSCMAILAKVYNGNTKNKKTEMSKYKSPPGMNP